MSGNWGGVERRRLVPEGGSMGVSTFSLPDKRRLRTFSWRGEKARFENMNSSGGGQGM